MGWSQFAENVTQMHGGLNGKERLEMGFLYQSE